MRTRNVPTGWAALLATLVLSACGGNTSRQRPTAAEPTADGLRFSKLAAGLDRYCGLTLDEADLVCVAAGEIVLERPGPFLDFALHEDLGIYRELCTVDATGRLACDSSTEALTGPFRRVAAGFFNSCALDDAGQVTCWLPPEVGGSPAPMDVKGAVDLSVDMHHGCVRFDDLGHVRCFGSGAPEYVSDLHFIRVSATPSSACGIALGPSLAAGVSCASPGGVTTVLPGTFSSLDTNVDGDGCALDAGGIIRCWGRLTSPEHDEPLTQVSVSSAMVCGLTAEGAARCFEP